MHSRREKFWLILPGLGLLGLYFWIGHALSGDEAVTPPVFSQFVSALTSPEHMLARTSPVNDRTSLETETAPTARSAATPLSAIPVPRDRAILRLVDEQGNAVAGAAVKVLQRPNFDLQVEDTQILGVIASHDATSGPDGALSVPFERASQYDLIIQADGFAPRRYRYRDPGYKIVRLTRGAAVWGRVEDESGRPVAGVAVKVAHDGAENFEVSTDANGLYEAANVAAGEVLLSIATPEYESVLKHLSVEPGARYCRDIRLRRGDRLEVDVRSSGGAAAGFAHVAVIELNSGRLLATRTTDAAGFAEFAILQSSRSYMVTASHPGFGLGRVFVNGSDVRYGVARVVIELQIAITAFGRVVTTEGLPVPGARLAFQSEMQSSFGTSRHYVVATAGEDGRFEAGGFLRGLNYAAICYHDQFAISLVERISNGPARHDLQLEFVLMPPAVVRGVIRDANGATVAGALVTLAISDPGVPGIGRVLISRTDADGRYTFDNVPPGQVWVEASSLQHGSSVIPGSFIVEEQQVLDGDVVVERP